MQFQLNPAYSCLSPLSAPRGFRRFASGSFEDWINQSVPA
jgi:hypothetical protein